MAGTIPSWTDWRARSWLVQWVNPERVFTQRAGRGPAVSSGPRRRAEDDVEPRGQLADPRALDGGEFHRELLAPLRRRGPPVDPVALVARVPLDEALRRQLDFIILPDLEVDVGSRPPRVRDRLDGPEVVFAGRAGQEAAEPLEVGVVLVPVLQVGPEVRPVAVALPDLDDRVADRVALGIEDLAAEVRDFAHSGSDGIVDDEQVVVGVEGELGRVERALLNARGTFQLLGEGASGRERGGAKGQRAEEPSAA